MIDENGQVTIAGDLKVQGGHVHMETERIVGADDQIDINSKYDENSGTIVGNATYGPNAANGGIQLFLTENSSSDHVQFTFDNSNKRWTTANSSDSLGLATAINTGGGPGTEKFKVLSSGDLHMGTGASDKFKVTAQDGHVDMSGNLKVFGNVTAGDGSTNNAGIFQSNGNQDVTLQTGNINTGSITITDGANGNITVVPNGTGKLIINSSGGLTNNTS